MDKTSLLTKLEVTLTDWEQSRQWGEIWLEIKNGEPTLLKVTAPQKLNAFQINGGIPHVRRETR
jgi:hypothetical protein